MLAHRMHLSEAAGQVLISSEALSGQRCLTVGFLADGSRSAGVGLPLLEVGEASMAGHSAGRHHGYGSGAAVVEKLKMVSRSLGDSFLYSHQEPLLMHCFEVRDALL